ncbi:MAG: endonuclease/exonuclease/phosphatase family protein [Dongiaceae bacterium]
MTVADRAHVRLCTWNVHSGIGPDGQYDLERIIALVRRHDPDIVALQEIDSRGRGGPLPLDRLKAVLGPHTAQAKTIVAEDGDYGHVLISRWPIDNVTLHDLSIGKREPRCLIEATISTPHGALTVAAAHLGFHLSEIHRQLAKMAAITQNGIDRFVLIGDFNDWHRQVRRRLSRLGFAGTSLNTFPAAKPLLPLDRIFCRPGTALINCWTDRLGRHASDHLPVFADLQTIAG